MVINNKWFKIASTVALFVIVTFIMTNGVGCGADTPKLRNEIVIHNTNLYVYGEDGIQSRLLDGTMKHPIVISKTYTGDSNNTLYVNTWVPEKGTDSRNRSAIVKLTLNTDQNKQIYAELVNLLSNNANHVYSNTAKDSDTTKTETSLYIY